MGGESAGNGAVRRLEFRAWPKRRGKGEAADLLVGHGALQNRLNFIQAAGDFAFVGSGDEQPTGFLGPAHAGLDFLECGVSRAVSRTERIRGALDSGETARKPGRDAKRSEQGGDPGQGRFVEALER